MFNSFNQYLRKKSVGSSILKGVFWSFLGTLISKGLLFLSFIIVARFLTVEDYGKLGVIRSTITTFSLFSVASFGVTATKYLALHVGSDKLKAMRILSMTRLIVFILALVISSAVYIFSSSIASKFLQDPSLSSAVQLSSIGIFFTAMNGLQTGILAGLEKFKYISIINIANGIFSFAFLLWTTVYFGLYGGIFALVTIQFILWLFSLYYLKRSFKEESMSFKLIGFRTELHIMKDFTLPTFIAGIIIPPVIYACELFIIDSPGGYSQLGIYKAAYNFSVITLTLNSVIGQVLYPFVMKNRISKSRNLEFFNQTIPFLIGVGLNLPFILLPNFFASIFGTEYMNPSMYKTIILISLSTIIISHRQGISRNFASHNYMWWSILGNSVWGGTAILFVSYFSDMGAIGLAFGLFGAYFLNTIIFLPFYTSKELILKKDLFNRYSAIIWFVILTSGALNFLNIDVLSKIFIAIFIILLVLYFGVLWIKKEINFSL